MTFPFHFVLYVKEFLVPAFRPVIFGAHTGQNVFVVLAAVLIHELVFCYVVEVVLVFNIHYLVFLLKLIFPSIFIFNLLLCIFLKKLIPFFSVFVFQFLRLILLLLSQVHLEFFVL